MKKSVLFKFMAYLLLFGVIVFVEGCGSGYETVVVSTFNERAGGSVCFSRCNKRRIVQ